ncbi:MAG: VWA domain-containing protein [Phycisphaerae bacterium]
MELLSPTHLLRVTHPEYLALLAVVPLVILVARRSLAGLGPIRQPLAVALRCGVIALLALALAGPERVRVTDDQTAVFVLDHSASVPRDQQQAAFNFVKRAAREIRPGKDRVALMTFDGAPTVEQLASDGLRVDRLGAGSKPYQTNLAGALRMAMALFPPDTARRVVLLSDGNENIGQALEDADAYAAAGVPIDVTPLRYEHQKEMLIERLTAPASAKLDETVNLGLIIRSQSPASARVLLYQNDQLVDLDPSSAQAGYPVTLDAGHNRFTIPVPLRQPGAHRFRAVLEPERAADDAVAANNEGRAFTIVGSAERVLILTEPDTDQVSTSAQSADVLERALRQAGIECDVRSVGEVVLDPAFLAGCSLVILSNVSAFSLGEAQQQALASFVRDLGGGLIAIGGDRAFSMGGYQKTPLEEVLPVETDRAKLKLLSLSMVIVIDRSGSMSGEKIEMAKKAAIGAVQLLSRLDRIGVIAFEGRPEWIVPLALCENKQAVLAKLAQIGPGGGTNMYPALEQAYSALAPLNTNLKHVIVLTDGQSEPGDFEGIARRFGNAGITVSTIAVGPDADRNLLTLIAQLSGGRMYATDNAQPLPQIFVRETVLASRSGLFERSFTPKLRGGDDPVLAGFTQADFAPLEGYVVTAVKPLAQAPLTRPHEDGTDPILAHWQVGLGRSIAFTSGLWPRWGPQWVQWPGFSKLWAQCVRYAARSGQSSEFQITTQIEGEHAKLVLEASDQVSALSSVAFAGQLVTPDFAARPLELRQTGPGRFEATFRAPEPGTYVASIAYQYGNGVAAKSGRIQTGLTVTYSPEYAAVTQNEVLLSELARRTGGRVLYPEHPEAVYEPWSIRPVEARLPVWEDLVRLALFAFLVDVAVRRLAIHPFESLRRVRSFLRELAGFPASPNAAATVATLRGVRERAQASHARAVPDADHGRSAVTEDSNTVEAGRMDTTTGGRTEDDLARLLSGSHDRPAVAAPKKSPAVSGEGEAEYASRLLRAKQEAKRRTQG